MVEGIGPRRARVAAEDRGLTPSGSPAARGLRGGGSQRDRSSAILAKQGFVEVRQRGNHVVM